MIVVIAAIYIALVWLIYFRLRLLPFNLTNKIGVALVGCAVVFGLFLAMSYAHPHSSDVRIIRSVIPISSYLPSPAQVVDVPVQPNMPVNKGDVLFRLDSRPYESEVRRLEAALASANFDLPKLEADRKAAGEAVAAADAAVENARGDMVRAQQLRPSGGMSEQEFENIKARLTSAQASQRQAVAEREKAQLALETKIGGEFTSVAQIKQQLAAARVNLQNTTVTAPDDGFVTDLAIRPGLTVAPSSPVLVFISTTRRPVVVALYSQNPLHHIAPGDRCEIAFAMLPGRIVKGAVETIIPITGQGQVTPTGDLPEVTAKSKRGRFAVRLTLDDDILNQLPAGAAGSSVIYTQTLRPLGAIQKMAIRMESYLNYLTGL